MDTAIAISNQDYDFYDALNGLQLRISRAGAVLRLIQDKLHDHQREISVDDLNYSVEICTENLSEEKNKDMSEIEHIYIAQDREIKTLSQSIKHSALIDQTFITAYRATLDPKASTKSLKNIGDQLCQLAKQNVNIHERFEHWVKVVELRGFSVSYVSNGEVTHFEILG